MKKELLSPAGDIECLKAAVHAGCDAVYVGGKKFGARAFATNFDEDALTYSVKYCHLYGVKLYVTVNVMVYEEELEEVLDYVGFLNSINVDALIVQDIGLICEIRKFYPNLEIHASTQLHNICQENCQLLEKIGVKRVVLARELTLSEINGLSTSLEKEVFIHGAICISYSGQCLFSSLVMGRSGNRGACAGMCRLPYSLEDRKGNVLAKEQYLLSTKELSTISRFQELMESDITCFKIEGRMKSPAYVYFVTKVYRTLMDQYERGEKCEISKEDFEHLKVLYNREFTEGHLFSKRDFDLLNIESPNHIGISLGEVVEIKNNRLKIFLNHDLHQEDGIRFLGTGKGMIVNFLYNQKQEFIKEAKSGSFVWIDNKVRITKCCLVRKTSDKVLLDYLKNYPLKKIPITAKCVIQIGKPLQLSFSDGVHEVSLSEGVVEKSVKCPTTYDEVYCHLNRLGNTPYFLQDANIVLEDDVFVPMSILNELRRKLVDQLTESRIFHKTVDNLKKYEVKSGANSKKNVQLCCLVRTEEQLQVALTMKIARIYVTDFSLYKKYKDRSVSIYYRQRRIHSRKIEGERILATEISQLEENSCSLVTDYYLNVANSSYLQFLESKKVSVATLSVEMTKEQILSLADANFTNVDLEVLVYGRVELMIMKHCPLHMLLHKGNSVCQVCKDSYYIVDRNHERYPLLAEAGITHLFHARKERFTNSELCSLISSKIAFIRVEFFDEDAREVVNILKKYQHLLQK